MHYWYLMASLNLDTFSFISTARMYEKEERFCLYSVGTSIWKILLAYVCHLRITFPAGRGAWVQGRRPYVSHPAQSSVLGTASSTKRFTPHIDLSRGQASMGPLMKWKFNFTKSCFLILCWTLAVWGPWVGGGLQHQDVIERSEQRLISHGQVSGSN